ncbi:hypothetical protein [Leptospira kirschneri]|uniref:hypothetical protein n=1 Tax=Leptospira kirschneri TaxID=29507 RepID=UPI00046C8669
MNDFRNQALQLDIGFATSVSALITALGMHWETKDPTLIADVILDAESGDDEIRIKVLPMTEHEYSNLPEWDGP